MSWAQAFRGGCVKTHGTHSMHYVTVITPADNTADSLAHKPHVLESLLSSE